MDALVTETALTYGGPPPLLIAATSEAALRRARETASVLGMRAIGQVGIAEARQRLSQQAATSGIWIELDGGAGEELDLLLDEVEERAAARRFAAVVSLTSDLIDSVSSRMFDGHDGRRVFVELSREASVAMRRYFAEVGKAAVI